MLGIELELEKVGPGLPVCGWREADMKRFRFGPGLLVTAAFIGPRDACHRQPRRSGLRRGSAVGRSVLGGRDRHPAGHGGRVGLAGRRGLAEAIRDSLASRWVRVGALGLIAGTILLGNAAFQTGNLIGAALGLNLLSGQPTALLALGIGGLAGGLLMTGTYRTIQNTMVGLVGLMSLVFCAVAVLTAPDLGNLIAGYWSPACRPALC